MSSDHPAGAEPGPVQIAERRLHPTYLLISLGRSVRSLIPAIAVGVWKAPGPLIGGLAALLFGLAVAHWWTRRYSVLDGSLRVSSGLLRRTQDTIGINRITAVDAQRGVIQRLLGVWGVKIQTPGNDHRSAVHLVCLSASALEELRAALTPSIRTALTPSTRPTTGGPFLEAPENQPGSDDQPVPVTLAVLDTRSLLVAAFTGTSIPLILAGAAVAFGRAHDVLPERTFAALARDVFVGGLTTALLLSGAVVLAVLAGVALTSLRLARFTLIRDGSRLRITRGLLAQRSGTIPIDRVQAVRLVEGFWRRMLGYCSLEVEVAGLSTSNDAERTLFPLIRTDRAVALVADALPELQWRPAPLIRVPAGARRRYFTLPVLIGLPATAGLALLPGWGAYLALTPIPLAVLIGWGQATDAAWLLDETTVTVRWRRVLARHTLIARRRRVQMTQVSRTPFQRRAGLSGVRLRLSSGRKARLRHLAAQDATLLLHAVGRRPAAHTPESGPRAPAGHVP